MSHFDSLYTGEVWVHFSNRTWSTIWGYVAWNVDKCWHISITQLYCGRWVLILLWNVVSLLRRKTSSFASFKCLSFLLMRSLRRGFCSFDAILKREKQPATTEVLVLIWRVIFRSISDLSRITALIGHRKCPKTEKRSHTKCLK